MKKNYILSFFIFSFLIGAPVANAQYTNIFDFAGTNGSYPQGDLISDGTFLYGMTYYGGTNNMGVIFKIKPDGTGYNILLNFSGTANGSYPYGSLISDGGFLYGMTQQGGTNNLGVLFKIKSDGTGYFKLLDFTGGNGKWPYGSLISVGTFLYGMTQQGGTNNLGVLFKIKPDGTGYSNLLDFSGAVNGSKPLGSLFSDGVYLYGMTYQGGTNNLGVLFKIKPDGTGYSDLLDFSGAANGSFPSGSLTSYGSFLYGMTDAGGANNLGVIFKIKPDGTGYSDLLDFSGAANGSNPHGTLISEGAYLFGMAQLGGTNNLGVLFKIKPDGTGYSDLLNFSGAANGKNPYGSLISDGNFLYGMTYEGGTNDTGTVFKMCFEKFFTQSPTVCTGQNVTVGSNTYTISGTYTDVLTAASGCDSTVTTHLTVLSSSVVSSSQTLILCFGQSVNVGTDTYTTSGTYTYDFLGSGCDSTVTTNLTVLPANTFTQSPTVCTGQSVIVGSHTYTVSGTYTDVLTSYHGCDSTVTTNLTVLPANTFSQFPIVCAGQDVTVGIHTYTTSGTYTDVLTAANGCDSTVTTHLTVNPLPAANAGADYTICTSGSVLITATGNGTFTWSPSAGLSDAAISDPVANPTMTTTYTLTVTNSCGTGTSFMTITIGNTPSVNAGNNASICTGGNTTLNASGSSGAYTWSPSAGLSDAATSNPVANPTVTTTYTVILTASCGTATDSVMITVNATPTISISGNTTICYGTSVSLSASGGTNYVWEPGGQSTNSVMNSPTVSTTYTVTGTDGNNCSNSATTTVSVNSLPDVTTNLSGVTLTANQNGAAYQWLDCTTGYSPIVGAANQSYTITSNGNYAVVVTLNSCSDTSVCVNVSITGINETEKNNQLLVYPNPSNGVFTIQSTSEGIYSILNELGQTIRSIKLNTANKYTMGIENLSSGIYLIVGFNNNQITKQKVVVTK